jgi:tryptophan synthase alpha chain
MNRIDERFIALRGRGEKALMPFITAGDPDLVTTAALLPALEQAGASVVELGIPFSDPIADGPVIEQSMSRALAGGVRFRDVLAMVREVRPQVSMGLVAMVSYSIVYRHGVTAFTREAAEAGLDGLIVPDLALEESGGLREAADAAGLTLSLLIAPSTSLERAKKIAAASSGFVYIVSRAGTTGAQTALPPELGDRLGQLRSVTDAPLAVGFGIANAEHVRAVVSVADAAIVGSAMMREIAQLQQADQAAIVQRVSSFCSELASGLSEADSPSVAENGPG